MVDNSVWTIHEESDCIGYLSTNVIIEIYGSFLRCTCMLFACCNKLLRLGFIAVLGITSQCSQQRVVI